jgi:hypothetical protein
MTRHLLTILFLIIFQISFAQLITNKVKLQQLSLEYYENVMGTGSVMKAATIKALIVNIANEADPDDSPDYMFGSGLMNTEKVATIIGEDASVMNVLDEQTLNKSAILYTPYFNLSTLAHSELSFSYHMHVIYMGSLKVQIFYNGDWVTIFSKSGQQQSLGSDDWV